MRLLKLLIVIAICLSLSVVAFAHPGRTDSNGGHTDHSTGEYHYHHGYPAHQHSDLDGDGDLDCPYLFDDKTGTSSGKIEKDKTNVRETEASETEPSKVKTESKKETTEKEDDDNRVLLIGVGALLSFLFIRWIVKEVKNKS